MEIIKNKVVLVTGASSGIGQSTALMLKNAGYIVYGVARRTEKMKSLKDAGINIFKMDVTNEDSQKEGIAKIIKEQGRIDVLVNNAGTGLYGAFEDIPVNDGKALFDLNVFGTAHLTKLVLPYMRKNNFGRIINISSCEGKMYQVMGSYYVASKYAVEGLSDCLRTEVEQFNIDVVLIEPGPVKTAFGDISIKKLLDYSSNGAYKDLAHKNAKVLELTTGSNALDPDEVAKAVLKGIAAKKPKTRYKVGKISKGLIFLRKIASDRVFDKMLHFYENHVK